MTQQTAKSATTGARIAVGIGANLGNAKAAVAQAITTLSNQPGLTDVISSAIYQSAPIDSSGPDYFNAVLMASTDSSPEQILTTLQNAETAAGRERPYRNAPRSLDLDLLLYDCVQMNSARLTLPHPRMHLRAFVLVPLAQIAPDINIPGHGPISELLSQVQNQSIVAAQ